MLKPTKSNWKAFTSMFEAKVRYEIMARFMDRKNIETLGLESDPFTLKLRCEDEMMEMMWGTSDLVKLGLQFGILKERPEKTRKRKAKKAKEELLERFDGKPRTD